MNRPTNLKKIILGLAAFGTILATASRSEAGLTLNSSSGSITYGVYETATNNNSPSFVNNLLVYPGGGLPVLQNYQDDSPIQSTNANSLVPSFFSAATTNSSNPNGFVGSNFGTATTEIYAAGSGQQGSFTTQGGVYWTLRTMLADNLSSGNLASVSFSHAVATFTNNSGASMSITPGAILSVSGTLGTLTSANYVAAGLATSITLFGGGVTTTTTNLDPVILAANGSGTNIAAKGTGAKEFASVTVTGNVLTGTGTSLSPTRVTLVNGGSITVSAYLTLISDPGSTIGVSAGLADGFPTDPSFLPDFGVFANTDALTTVPEPATITLLGVGLAMAGLWSRTRNRRAARS